MVTSFNCPVVFETDNRLLLPGQRIATSSPLYKLAIGDVTVGSRKLVPSSSSLSFDMMSGDMSLSSDEVFMVHSEKYMHL